MAHAIVRLWNSYNFGIAAASKTYAPGATSPASNSGMPRVAAPLFQCTGVFLMMDIFMSALGLAFFAAAIGYAYACERL
ncbi:MAG TPA: hypothetical protein VNY08_07460 [Bradyrhizobium sp.]|nr:hypothetical protein [Bradyrhizobium sp.]